MTTLTAPPHLTVALVTLGLRPQRGRLRGAGRAAGGRRLPAGRRPEPTPRPSWSTPAASSRPAKKDSVDTLLAAADLKDAGRHPGRGRGRLPGRAVRQGARRVAARGRRGARLRRLPRHRRAAALDPGRRGARTRTRPRTGAGCCRSRPSTATPRRLRARPRPIAWSRRDHRRRRACDRAARRAPPARRRPDGAAQAGQRLRPALLVLRDPELPRLVRQPAAQRRARRGALAGRAGRARAVPGQRELHVLRQGPRRPAAAGDAAARARRDRRGGAGAGVLPPARRDPARPGRGDRGDARRGAVLRPLLPARVATRCCAGCAGSATPTASSALLDAGPRAGPDGRRALATSSSASPARPRTTCRRCATSSSAARLDVIGVFGYSDEDGTEAASYDGKLDEDEVARPGRARHRAGRGAHRPAGRGADRRARSRCWSSRSTDDGRRGPGRAPGSRGRRVDAPGRGARRWPVGDMVRGGGRRHRGRRPGRRVTEVDASERRRASRETGAP